MQEERIERAKNMDEDVRKLDADINAKKLSLSEDKLAEMAKQLSDKKIAMQRFAQDADREVGGRGLRRSRAQGSARPDGIRGRPSASRVTSPKVSRPSSIGDMGA